MRPSRAPFDGGASDVVVARSCQLLAGRGPRRFGPKPGQQSARHPGVAGRSAAPRVMARRTIARGRQHTGSAVGQRARTAAPTLPARSRSGLECCGVRVPARPLALTVGVGAAGRCCAGQVPGPGGASRTPGSTQTRRTSPEPRPYRRLDRGHLPTQSGLTATRFTSQQPSTTVACSS